MEFLFTVQLLGITGSVGTGKSTAGRFLQRKGLQVIDTDEIARTIVEPGEPALDEIRVAFGSDFIDSDGRLRRRMLADAVFGDAQARRRLEAILHPRIRNEWKEAVTQWRAGGVRRAAVLLPLLFETGAEREFDAVICTACSWAIQLNRLALRGWSRADSLRRVEAQWPADLKIVASDFVVWTESTLDLHDAQIGKIVDQMDG